MERAVAGDSGIVHEDVDGTDFGFDGLDACFAGGGVADVELEDRDAGLGLEGVGGLVVAAVIRGDLVALGLEARRDGGTDAARSAGDEGDAFLSHGFLQFS